MEELINLVVKKTGIPEATARKAVEVVVDYLKEKLPAPLGSMVDDLLVGDTPGDLLEGLGGLLGGKK